MRQWYHQLVHCIVDHVHVLATGIFIDAQKPEVMRLPKRATTSKNVMMLQVDARRNVCDK